MSNRFILLFAVLAVGCWSEATGSPLVRPVSSTTTVLVGQDISIGIDIENAVFVNGYQFDLQFDPLRLEFVSLAEGTFLPTPLFSAPLFDSSDLLNGNLLAIANYMADTGVSGSGRLVNVVFRAIASGEATINAIGGLYTSLDDFENGQQQEITATTIESLRLTVNELPQTGNEIPEPGTMSLFALAGATALCVRLRR